MIPYGRQDISEADIQAVVNVLRSDFLTQGPKVVEFEKAVSAYCDTDYGVAVNSGTSALHIACLALGVSSGDIVWTSPITFVASANCARFCGAAVDFVDIDPLTFNMSVDALEAKLEIASKENKLPKVVIPVHMCGQSCDMRSIKSLADHYGFSIIEDASHAMGGKYLGKPIGCCNFSDITVFSLHPVKIITTGEGGLTVTNKPVLAEKMRLYSNHFITRNPTKMARASDGPWYYEQLGLGFNYRMTDIQAALGISQLIKIDDFVKRRHTLAERYDEHLDDLIAVDLPKSSPDTYSAFHLYIIRLKQDEMKKNRLEVFQQLRDHGIGVNVHYIPVHTQPYYQALGFEKGDFPEAERYYAEAITIPLYHHMSFDEQDKVINELKEIIK